MAYWQIQYNLVALWRIGQCTSLYIVTTSKITQLKFNLETLRYKP